MSKKKAVKLEQAEIPVPAKQEVFAVPVTALRHHPDNARVHDLETIKTSLKEHGQYVPILVQPTTNEILKGNGTFDGVVELGWPTINVVYADVTEDEAREIVAIDNLSSDKASYAAALYAKLWDKVVSRRRARVAAGEQLDIFAGTGIDIDTYETLMAQGDQITVTQLEETAAKHADDGTVDPERMQRAKAVSQVAQAKGFHEVILMYPVDSYNEFMARVKALQKFWSIESVSLTVLEMLAKTVPPTPEETEQAFLALQDDIKAQKGNELLTAFQAGVYTRSALAKVEA